MTIDPKHAGDLQAATEALAAARAGEAAARARLREVVLAALADGAAEAEIARETGLSRMTVRAWRAEAAGEAETAT